MQESKGCNKANVNKTIIFAASLLVAFLTFLVYLPSLQNGFVSFDDPIYITGNPIIRSLDFRFVKLALTKTVSHNWHPLTIFSCAIDYAFWKLNPWGYHLTNMIFHALNTFLVGLLSIKLIRLLKHEDSHGYGPVIAGVVTALLFGLHPLHVESVSWISERKDVLSAFFFLLSVLSYIGYASSLKKTLYYYASMGFFFLALLSKPMAVTLPAVLLILDYYPLERLKPGKAENIQIIIEKLPFFLLSAGISVVTIMAQRGAMASLEAYKFTFRLTMALRAYIFYLYKTVLPLNLAPYYQRPPESGLFNIAVILSIILLLLITAVCVITIKKGLRAIWFYYLITLLPVIGIVQVGGQVAADRYMYLPSLGPFILIGAGVSALIKPDKKPLAVIVITGTAVLFIALSVLTVNQEAIWKDTFSLWSHEIGIFPGKVKIAYNSRGSAYYNLGDYDRALDDLNTAISLDSKYALAYNNRGLVYKGLGDYGRAIKDFSTAITLDPRNSFAFINRADTYKEAGDYTRAMDDYNAAVMVDPENSLPYNQRGLVYKEHGDFRRALDDYSTAISRDPSNPLPYNNRGSVYAQTKEYDLAISDFSKAITLQPDFALAFKNRGTLDMELGRYDQAIEDFNRASALSPRDPSLYILRGVAFLNGGSYAKAADDFSNAIRINSKLPDAYYYLGVSYYKAGQIDQAAQYLRKASLMGVKEAQEFLNKQGIK